MNRTIKALLVAWSISAVLACHASPAAQHPNIRLILADDIGCEALNCYGGLDFETPNLNRMASGGVRFNRA